MRLYRILYLFLCFLLLLTAHQAVNAQAPASRPVIQQPSDTNAISRATISGIRTGRATLRTDNIYYLTDQGKQGMFMADPGDRQSADDSAMTLVTATGVRLKRMTDGKNINVRWFGATGTGSIDDYAAIQRGIDYIINTDNAPRTLYFPQGRYRIDNPLIIAKITGGAYRQVSITLEGPANSKDIANGSAIILPTFNDRFAIGVQLGKGVIIKDLMIRGKFIFPNKLTEVQVDTLAAKDWTDGSTRDNRSSPYAGVVIDPFSDPASYVRGAEMYPGMQNWYLKGMSKSGSTAVQVVGCSMTNFIVGVMITPSVQYNGELIDVIDCDISDCKIAYAMGQAQSKECHVDRLKCWGATHTLFDNMNYGVRKGDGAAVPMVDGVNLAGFAKQLCAIDAASFGGVFRNVYAEGLFRVGYVGGSATVAFEDCQLNFSTIEPNMPYPDYFVLGSGTTFRNCMLRHYIGRLGARMILTESSDLYDGGIMNEPPVTVNLNNCGSCATPTFSHVIMYYSGGMLGSGNNGITTTTRQLRPANGNGFDPVYFGSTYLFRDPLSGGDLLYRLKYNTSYERSVALRGDMTMHVDYKNWTGSFQLAKPEDANLLKKGDFILTTGLHFQDQFTDRPATTYPVGIVTKIDNGTVYLENLAIGIREGMRIPLWMNYYVYTKPAFTGDMAAGSSTMTHVQGDFPAVGDRPDCSMLPAGAYVTAVDPGSKTITFSAGNNTGKAYNDYTSLNGYPIVEMHSVYDLPYLQKSHNTLIGNANFYLYDAVNKSQDPSSVLGGNYKAMYRNLNTIISGDTSLHKLTFKPLMTDPH